MEYDEHSFVLPLRAAPRIFVGRRGGGGGFEKRGTLFQLLEKKGHLFRLSEKNALICDAGENFENLHANICQFARKMCPQ